MSQVVEPLWCRRTDSESFWGNLKESPHRLMYLYIFVLQLKPTDQNQWLWCQFLVNRFPLWLVMPGRVYGGGGVFDTRVPLSLLGLSHQYRSRETALSLTVSLGTVTFHSVPSPLMRRTHGGLLSTCFRGAGWPAAHVRWRPVCVTCSVCQPRTHMSEGTLTQRTAFKISVSVLSTWLRRGRIGHARSTAGAWVFCNHLDQLTHMTEAVVLHTRGYERSTAVTETTEITMHTEDKYKQEVCTGVADAAARGAATDTNITNSLHMSTAISKSNALTKQKDYDNLCSNWQ